MGKLSFEVVKESFLSLYPNGQIWQDEVIKNKYSLNVAFTEGGKVYTYKVNNNIDAMKRLKLADNLIYKHDYNFYIKEISRLETEIKNGFYIDDFFGTGEKINYTPEDLKNLKSDLKRYTNQIENKIII